jgi:hypothetical protein
MSRRKLRRDRLRHLQATHARRKSREVRLFRRWVELDPGYDYITLDKLAETIGGVGFEDGTFLTLLVPRRPYADIDDFDDAVLATGFPEFVRKLPGDDPFGHGPNVRVRRRPGWEPDGPAGRIVTLDRPNGDDDDVIPEG